MKDILLALGALAVATLCMTAGVVQAHREHRGEAIVLLLAGISICVGALRLAWRKLR